MCESICAQIGSFCLFILFALWCQSRIFYIIVFAQPSCALTLTVPCIWPGVWGQLSEMYSLFLSG